MTARIRIRRAVQANWKSDNPTLDHGEIGLSYVGTLCVGFKVGDGTTVWNSLPLFKPPTIPEDGTDQTSNILWADVARLAGDNTFTDGEHIFGPTAAPADDAPLTVKGKLTVTESSSTAADGHFTVSAGDVGVTAGDVTVTAGDVTLVNGELTIPLHAHADDTHSIGGAATTKGGIAFNTDGVIIGNSGVGPGKLKKADFSEWGPNILVKSDKIVVGGYDSATTSDDNKTTLEYAAAPAGKTDIEDLDDLVVPTALQVITHVAAEKWMLNSLDPPVAGYTWVTLAANTLQNYNLYTDSVGDLLPAGVTSGVTHIQIMASAEEGDGYCTVAAGKQSIGLAINVTNYVIKGVAVASVGPTASDDHDRNQSTALVPIDANGDFSVKAFDSANFSYAAQFTVVGYCK